MTLSKGVNKCLSKESYIVIIPVQSYILLGPPGFINAFNDFTKVIMQWSNICNSYKLTRVLQKSNKYT